MVEMKTKPATKADAPPAASVPGTPAPNGSPETRLPRRCTPGQREAFLQSDEARATLDAALIARELRQLRRERRKLEALACSSAWVDDCWEQGARYCPTVRCNCHVCKKRRRFPDYYVRNGRSYECWIEAELPRNADLAEALRPLGYATPGGVVIDGYALRRRR